MSSIILVLAIAAFAISNDAGAFLPCDSPIVSHGPFDYRTGRKELEIVERQHFTSDVETLRRGNTSSTPAGDLSYTLLASPNHHRALMAMANLSIREKNERPRDSTFTVPCYFERAMRFAPDDGAVRVIFATYLIKVGRKPEALEQLTAAESLKIESANLHYNMGLSYFELDDFDKALRHAQRAYSGGFELPGLRMKLQKAGKWRDTN